MPLALHPRYALAPDCLQVSPIHHDARARGSGLRRAVLVCFADQAHSPGGSSVDDVEASRECGAGGAGTLFVGGRHDGETADGCAEECDPQQLPFRLHEQLPGRHARRRRGAAMPAKQFGEIVVRVPKRGRRDQPAGRACGCSGACGRSRCSTGGARGCSGSGACNCSGRGTRDRPGRGACGPHRGAAAATDGRAARGDPPGLPGRFPLPLPGRTAGWRAGAAMPARPCA